MTEPYTPTDEEVRTDYVMAYSDRDSSQLEAGLAFDRWLADRDARVKAEALREAAEAGWDDVSGEASVPLLAPSVADWLHERANRIEAGDTDE